MTVKKLKVIGEWWYGLKGAQRLIVVLAVITFFMVVSNSAKNDVRHSSVERVPTISPQYLKPISKIGLNISAVENIVGEKANAAGNVIVDVEGFHILFESHLGMLSFIDYEFKSYPPCSQKKAFNPKPFLMSLGIDSLLPHIEYARNKIHFHTFYDHKEKLKIGVSCLYDGASINVSIGKKYYLQ